MKSQGSLWVAGSLIIAALIIGGAILYTNNSESPAARGGHGGGQNGELSHGNFNEIRPADENDFIKGDLSAAVTIVEYSDTECPFCKRLHETLDGVVTDYEDVAWVYRHLPLIQLHDQAAIEAHATECAAAQGGNDGFWNYTDRLYELTPGNRQIDLDRLPEIAGEVGLNVDEFNTCMEEERHLDKVEEDFVEAVGAAGDALGTPFNVVLLKNELNDEQTAEMQTFADSLQRPGNPPTVSISEDGRSVAVSGALGRDLWDTILGIVLE